MEAIADNGRVRRASNYLKENPRTRRIVFLAGLVIIAAIVLLWRYYAARESTDDAQIDGHIVPISAKVGGFILQVNVHDNEYVKAGTVLARIDPRDYEVAVARAEADLEQAQAQATAAKNQASVESTGTQSALQTAQAQLQASQAELAGAQEGVLAARARLDAARANVREAESKYDCAAKDLERLRPLVAKDEISQREFDAAVSNADAARASVDSAKAAAAEAERNVATAEVRVRQIRQSVSQSQASLANARTGPEQIAVTQAQSSSAEAKVQQMKAALDQAKLNLQYTAVTAPVSGWVSRKSVEAGQVIQPTQTLLAVVPLEDVWVTANFKETQLKKMRPGEHADISVDAYGGKDYNGHVESISAATGARFSLLPPENATGNYVKVVQRIPVKIVFEKGQDPEHLLRPGMSVDVTVLTK